MNPIEHDRKVRRLVQQCLKVFNGLLFREIESELFLDLFVHIAMFDVRYVGVNHESDQVQNEVGALAQDGEGCEAKVLETCIVRGLRATHAINHLFAYFHGRGKWLRVTAQDITEVDCRKIDISGASEPIEVIAIP